MTITIGYDDMETILGATGYQLQIPVDSCQFHQIIGSQSALRDAKRGGGSPSQRAAHSCDEAVTT